MTYEQNTSLNDDDFFCPRIPKANVEGIAMGAGMGTNLNGSQPDTMLGDGVEAFGGGILGYAVYQSLLTFFALEPAVKAGTITRGQQLQQIQKTAWEATKGSAVAIACVSAVLAIFPALAPVAGLTAVVGGVVAGTRIVNAVMDAYSPEQKAVLRQKAQEAGINIKGLTDDDEGTAGAPVPA